MVGMTTRDAAVSWCLFWSRTACGFNIQPYCNFTAVQKWYWGYSTGTTCPGGVLWPLFWPAVVLGSVPSSCFALVLLDRGPRSLCVLPHSRPEIPDGAPAPHPECLAPESAVTVSYCMIRIIPICMHPGRVMFTAQAPGTQ